MCILQPLSETVGSYSPYPTTVSESRRGMWIRSLGYSNACTAGIYTREAESDWRSASASWNSMVAGFGWTDLSLTEDPPSASRFPRTGASAQSSASELSAAAEPLDVLLVEDNEIDIFVIRRALSECSFKVRVHVARDGEEALSYLKDDQRPSVALLLLDLNVPALSGLEVLRHLRSSPRFNRTPVVVVTSSDSDFDRDAVQALGAAAYFRKPTNLAAYMDLARVIMQVLPGGAPARGGSAE